MGRPTLCVAPRRWLTKNSFRTADVFEPKGAVLQITPRLAEMPMTVVLRNQKSFDPSDRLHLLPNLDRVHLFDTTTANRL